MKFISVPFNLPIFIIILVILYLYDLIKIKDIGLVVSAQFIIGIIKYIFKRNRPFIQNKKIKNYEILKFDKYSFPSGHSLNAFLLYYIFTHYYNISQYYIILPCIVAMSRVVLGVHYISDVICGALLAKLIVTTIKS
jgi:membrane-associated phospholipid phosphatase